MGKRKSMKHVIETLDDVWAVHIKIDGKRYALHETFTSKAAARVRAKMKRKAGYLARVKRVKNVFDRNYIPFKFLYRVYTRRK